MAHLLNLSSQRDLMPFTSKWIKLGKLYMGLNSPVWQCSYVFSQYFVFLNVLTDRAELGEVAGFSKRVCSSSPTRYDFPKMYPRTVQGYGYGPQPHLHRCTGHDPSRLSHTARLSRIFSSLTPILHTHNSRRKYSVLRSYKRKMHSLVEADAWVCLRLPSDTLKVVQVTPNT